MCRVSLFHDGAAVKEKLSCTLVVVKDEIVGEQLELRWEEKSFASGGW